MRLPLCTAVLALPLVLGGCFSDEPDECSSGETQCNRLLVEKCEFSFIIGHYIWEAVQDCSDTGQVCRYVEGVATCVTL